ncbi:MAG: hypothetical protein ABR985_02195 [Methanotrichaceae archaeon]
MRTASHLHPLEDGQDALELGREDSQADMGCRIWIIVALAEVQGPAGVPHASKQALMASIPHFWSSD